MNMHSDLALEYRHLEEVSSTNDFLRAYEPMADVTVLSASYQTNGRGQMGNTWISNSGENALFSILVCPSALKASDGFVLSQAMALSIKEVLDAYLEGISIKWPNDIYCGDEKICGILIENSLKGSEIDWSIIGIGLNVNQTSFPEHLPNPTSMRLCTGNSNPYNTREILEEFMGIFTGYYREYLNGNGALDRLEEQFVSNLRTNLSSPR